MKKAILLVFIMTLSFTKMQSQTPNPNHAWLDEARFGLFVHFGPYSVLGDGEWVMQNRPIKVQEYKKLQKFFNPQDFDAKTWVKIAKDAGMKYITFTSRHHDGFSNWNTKQSDWNIMNTPHFGRDIVKELADECHKEGIKLVLYYSLIDWSRTDYQYWTGGTGQGCGRTERGDWNSYINFMKAQLTELLTNYGDIAGIWFDGDWDQHPNGSHTHATSKVDWHYPEIYNLIHTLQPNCMISNNHHKEPLKGEDYQAFEKDLPGENKTGFSEGQTASKHIPMETCETMNNTWGYSITDTNFKSTTAIIHYLVKAAGYGANLLLNVGPMPNGEIQPESVKCLQEVGIWTKKFGQTIYGTQGGVIKPQSWGATTQKGKTHYIHLFEQDGNKFTINIPQKIKSARWVNIDSKLNWTVDKKTGNVTFDLLNVQFDDIDSIIEIVVQ
ncbi:alpha-L-fucosidase [Dysgonomonas alginatilytica]|uniref:alpha-L-fucosidase n=1 Tax=Dysgonomonas alginatilytica TaxID=1605892 RepID=A0A2V3PSF2_9BACT|nr:alpha-L-fucosidase [Dysgonomonas alginatilytica]PXV65097.1 alpha-L-fucosidase [Dysgonomonas alginatilytica]